MNDDFEQLREKVKALVFNVAHNGTLPDVATKIIMDAVESYCKLSVGS